MIEQRKRGMEHPGFWVGMFIGIVFGTLGTLALMFTTGLIDWLLRATL